MTENPTVPSPPGLPQQLLSSNPTSAPTPDESGDSSGEIRCVCDYTEDDGYTVCCDKCGTWQHVACVQLPGDNLPSEYLCSFCSPRQIDTRRARELQKQRRRDEKNIRRKRSSTTSHKKKEPLPNAPNGVATGKTAQGSEKTGAAKLPSPREPQPPTSRKRNSRASHSNHSVVGGANSSHATTSGSGAGSPVYLPDRNGDAESDNESEKYKVEYIDIGSDQNKYTSEDVKATLSKAITKSEICKQYSQQAFAAISYPKTSVKALPDSSKLYSEHSRWCLMLEASCQKGRPVSIFKGEIGLQETYKESPINQYSLWHHPKPYVIFHPELPIYLDARRMGSEARFARRSCKPNLVVTPMAVADADTNFGLFATESIKPGTELTLGWDWNGSKQSQRLAEEKFEFSKLATDEMKQAALWVDNLLEKIGDCACGLGADCLMSRIKKCGGIESVSPKRPVTNGNGRKRTKRNTSAESNPSKEASPDTQTNDHDDDDKSLTKVKPRSRDLTPSETAVESGTMTGREARKFKDVLSRIEKQSQEQQVQPNKRRKRNSISSAAPGTARSASPGSEKGRGTDEPARKKKSPKGESPATSPGSAREVSVVDASTGRSPGSSSGSRHASRNKGSSNASTTSSKVRRKVKTKSAAKSNYVDSSIQTEPDDELPWWKQPVQNIPPRPPRLPLRKRLMQSLIRDREEAASAATSAQDKKRKHDIFAEDTTVSLHCSKAPKTGDDESAHGVSVTEINIEAPGIVSPDTMPPTKEEPLVKGLSSPRLLEAGPALGDLFADSERPRRSKPPSLVSTEKSQVVSTRPSVPNLQLSTPAALTNCPITPGQVTPAFSPSVATALNNNSASSPVKTKKLSLEAYRKRSHKSVDPDKKEEEPAGLKTIVESTPALPFLNVLRPEDPLPTPPPSTVDSKIIANTSWGVR